MNVNNSHFNVDLSRVGEGEERFLLTYNGPSHLKSVPTSLFFNSLQGLADLKRANQLSVDCLQSQIKIVQNKQTQSLKGSQEALKKHNANSLLIRIVHHFLCLFGFGLIHESQEHLGEHQAYGDLTGILKSYLQSRLSSEAVDSPKQSSPKRVLSIGEGISHQSPPSVQSEVQEQPVELSSDVVPSVVEKVVESEVIVKEVAPQPVPLVNNQDSSKKAVPIVKPQVVRTQVKELIVELSGRPIPYQAPSKQPAKPLQVVPHQKEDNHQVDCQKKSVEPHLGPDSAVGDSDHHDDINGLVDSLLSTFDEEAFELEGDLANRGYNLPVEPPRCKEFVLDIE